MVGCGGDDDDEDAATPAATQTAEATTEADDGGGSAGGGLTKPGTSLKLGETAHVTYKPLTATDDKNLFEVDATAVKIEKGSIDDFKNISLDEDQKASTPYYVTVKIENTGEEIPLGDMEGDPDLKSCRRASLKRRSRPARASRPRSPAPESSGAPTDRTSSWGALETTGSSRSAAMTSRAVARATTLSRAATATT
jgi:hypothetical protein